MNFQLIGINHKTAPVEVRAARLDARRRRLDHLQKPAAHQIIFRAFYIRAHDLAFAYGAGIGAARAGMVETSFAEETETDLFGEQTVLCGGVTQLIQLGFETLVEAGYQPEVAYYECLHELKLIVDLIWEGGIERMHYSISDTAEYGSHAVGPKVVDEHVRENMRSVLENIRNGSFAQEWIAEMERGQPSLEEYRRKLAEKQIEQVGARLRALNVKEETAGVG